MSKRDDLIVRYNEEFKKIGVKSVDQGLLEKVTKGLGPSIYLPDASKVSCGDKSELDRVKANYLIKKLGLKDDAKLDEAIKEVCETFGSSNRNKFRAMFYYMLCVKFKKAGIYK